MIDSDFSVRILLELDPAADPVWIFFDTQHRHILSLLQSSAEASVDKIRRKLRFQLPLPWAGLGLQLSTDKGLPCSCQGIEQ